MCGNSPVNGNRVDTGFTGGHPLGLPGDDALASVPVFFLAWEPLIKDLLHLRVGGEPADLAIFDP